MPGIEALARGADRLASAKTVRPPYGWRIIDQLRPIEIGVINRIRTLKVVQFRSARSANSR